MEINVLEDKEKPLLLRRELIADVVFESRTPSRDEIRKELAGKVKVNEELVIVTQINTEFGHRKAIVGAHIYKSKKDLESIEPNYLLKRHSKPEKEKPAEPKAEEKTKEKGTEEKQAQEKVAEKPKEIKEEKQEKAEKKPAEEPAPKEKTAEKPAEQKEEKPTQEPKEKKAE